MPPMTITLQKINEMLCKKQKINFLACTLLDDYIRHPSNTINETSNPWQLIHYGNILRITLRHLQLLTNIIPKSWKYFTPKSVMFQIQVKQYNSWLANM